jgi:hypothetical protein
VPLFVLHHHHAAEECGAAYGAFKGGHSPLRHGAALASCGDGGHEMWWTVEAVNEIEALGFLPYFLVERTTATKVAQTNIP